jgi:cytidyltransferase-like protein|tara:strand:- start:137 stop:592 length:456 start_codon:yes stop_codon:yes gene_type:complete
MSGRIVVISGYFNPIHSGHLDYIQEAKKLGDFLVVIVNNDDQVKIKGSIPFMDEEERARIVSSIKGVDYTYISTDEDGTVSNSLLNIYYLFRDHYDFNGMVFANGGDRKQGGIAEEETCNRFDIELAYNVGGEKTQSSSNLIKEAQENGAI